MSQASTAQIVTVNREAGAAQRIATVLNAAIFGALLLLIVATAVPYGTVDAWWKATFVCVVFLLAIGWIVEGFLSGSWRTGGRAILMPLIGAVVFSFLQTISLGSTAAGGVSLPFWNAISADPFQTRFFALELLALVISGALFYRYVNTKTRITALIYVIIGVAVASALFGILRQTTQHQIGFGLPLLRPEQGYGQFINKNHFALLMEIAFGLVLGLILSESLRREKILIYLAAMFPIWMALVLSNSRGGILGMLAQLVIGWLLFTSAPDESKLRNRGWLKVLGSLPVRIGLVIVLVCGVFVGILWVGGDRLADKIEAMRNEFDPAFAVNREGATRNEIWQATMRMFRDHPIAGVGMGGYWIGITAYHDASGTLTPQEAHNDYLELLSSGGLIAVALGAWFIFVVVKRLRRNLKSTDGFRRGITVAATIAIAGVAVHSLFDFGLHMLANALIFVALITIATREEISNGGTWESEL
ncbi:MAG TPA: O-antigen ligase family protein [Pyrinomonadaceae bacterium]